MDLTLTFPDECLAPVCAFLHVQGLSGGTPVDLSTLEGQATFLEQKFTGDIRNIYSEFLTREKSKNIPESVTKEVDSLFINSKKSADNLNSIL